MRRAHDVSIAADPQPGRLLGRLADGEIDGHGQQAGHVRAEVQRDLLALAGHDGAESQNFEHADIGADLLNIGGEQIAMGLSEVDKPRKLQGRRAAAGCLERQFAGGSLGIAARPRCLR